MNNKYIDDRLKLIGLSSMEAAIYYHLLKNGGLTHLQLSRETNIQRNKVYRLVDGLQKHGLVHQQTDDTGQKIHASKPEVLDLILQAQEQELHHKQSALDEIMPSLKNIAAAASSPLTFKVKTYDGESGFKQMLWNEVNTGSEVLTFGAGTLENLVESKAWCEKYRLRAVEMGYIIKEIQNDTRLKRGEFSRNEQFKKSVNQIRYVSRLVLDLRHTIGVYDNTVSTYCFQDGQKIGLEIINPVHANFYRQLFYKFWEIAEP